MAIEVEQRDLTITQGATFTLEYRWAVGRLPQSLKGCVVRFGVATRPGSPLLIEKSNLHGEIDVEPNGQTGLIRVVLTPLDTSKLTRPSRYDVVVVKSPTEAYRILQGVVHVDRAVTPTFGD